MLHIIWNLQVLCRSFESVLSENIWKNVLGAIQLVTTTCSRLFSHHQLQMYPLILSLIQWRGGGGGYFYCSHASTPEEHTSKRNFPQPEAKLFTWSQRGDTCTRKINNEEIFICGTHWILLFEELWSETGWVHASCPSSQPYQFTCQIYVVLPSLASIVNVYTSTYKRSVNVFTLSYISIQLLV